MALNSKFIYALILFCKFEKHAGPFLSRSTADPVFGYFHRAGALNVLYILQTGMHA